MGTYFFKQIFFFFSVTFFAMELFQRLGFADATLIVAVSATSLRAVGNVISGFIVIFKGTQINQNGSTYVILVIVRIFFTNR